MGPPDPILGVTVAFKNDPNPKKMNLGVGAYRDDAGQPFILSCVRKAETRVIESKANHEYAGIGGVPEFTQAAATLLFGADAKELKENRVATVQTLSGTGALRVAGQFLRRFFPNTDIYLPEPTWGNHKPIFKDSGYNLKSYTYYDGKGGLDFEGLKKDLRAAPDNSVVLLHACAHNPTGVDLSPQQWKELSKIFYKRDIFLSLTPPTKDSRAAILLKTLCLFVYFWTTVIRFSSVNLLPKILDFMVNVSERFMSWRDLKKK